jgi:hypothetical protein
MGDSLIDNQESLLQAIAEASGGTLEAAVRELTDAVSLQYGAARCDTLDAGLLRLRAVGLLVGAVESCDLDQLEPVAAGKLVRYVRDIAKRILAGLRPDPTRRQQW